MADTILDDVNMLLLKERGDKRILEQIRRAAANNEVISIYERNYVAKLKDVHSEKKKPAPAPPPKPPEPYRQPIHSPAQVVSGSAAPVQSQALTQVILQQHDAPKRKSSRTLIIIAAVAGAAAVALAVGLVALDLDFGLMTPGGVPPDGTMNPDPAVPPFSGEVSLSTDEGSYRLGDIISISGRSDPSSDGRAILSILDLNNELIWTDSVDIKPDGSFSTLVIAAGPGWNDSGTYAVTMSHDGASKRTEFAFQG